MANTTIDQLSPLSSSEVAANDSFLIYDESATIERQLSTEDLRTAMGLSPFVVSVNSSNTALRITQTGTGDALRVEDSANPDSTPFVVSALGSVGIGTASPTHALDINGDTLRIRTSKTPASANASGTQGQIAWDDDYIYVCIDTNTWKRSALSTW